MKKLCHAASVSSGVRSATKMASVPRDDAADTAFGVQLADASDEHGPGDTAAEAHHVAVNSSFCFGVQGSVSPRRPTRRRRRRTLGPELDGSERFPEDGNIGNQTEHLVRDTGASETADAALVEVPKQVVVLELEVVGDGGEGEAGKEQIDVDAGERALDDGDKGFRDRLQGEERGPVREEAQGRILRCSWPWEPSSCLGLTVTSTTPSVSLSMDSKRVWNSSRSTWRGTTRRVSMSDPGPWTPRR